MQLRLIRVRSSISLRASWAQPQCAQESQATMANSTTRGKRLTILESMAVTTTACPIPTVLKLREALVRIQFRWESLDGRVVRTKRSEPTGITFTRTRQ